MPPPNITPSKRKTQKEEQRGRNGKKSRRATTRKKSATSSSTSTTSTTRDTSSNKKQRKEAPVPAPTNDGIIISGVEDCVPVSTSAAAATAATTTTSRALLSATNNNDHTILNLASSSNNYGIDIIVPKSIKNNNCQEADEEEDHRKPAAVPSRKQPTITTTTSHAAAVDDPTTTPSGEHPFLQPGHSTNHNDNTPTTKPDHKEDVDDHDHDETDTDDIPLVHAPKNHPSAALADIDLVDQTFPRAAAVAFGAWFLMTSAVLYLHWDNNNPATDDGDADGDYNDSMERLVPRTAFFILLVSELLQMTPIITQRLRSVSARITQSDDDNNDNSKQQERLAMSGVLKAAMVIQTISLLTNALLGWGPRAIVIDPVIGSRVFLIRWCEWVPLSGFMTLLAESADMPKGKDAWKRPLISAICQSISTFCGIILPYCRTVTEWKIVMFISCITFSYIYPRVWARRKEFYRTDMGRTVLEREYYDRRRFAYYLILMCSIFWSGLVVMYMINMAIHLTLPADHWLRFPSLAMSCDTISDVTAKVLYTKLIVEAHQAVFASDLRTLRQLSELKQLMSVLWVSSSDVIVISTKQTERRNATMLSPSFLPLVGAGLPLTEVGRIRKSAALVLETDRGKVKAAYYVDTSTIANDPHPERIDQRILLAHEDLNSNAVQQALRIANATWTARVTKSDNPDDQPLRALSIVNSNVARGLDSKVMCELKVSRQTEQTAVAVVRNVTERYRRFEAESRAHAETIARQRDMHTANRFTRHEVKNGLLSSLELCRTLGQLLEELKTANNATPAENLRGGLKLNSNLVHERTTKSLMELDGTLHGVLDTVLAEVMAREVVNEVYQPRLEGLDVSSILTADRGMSKARIPLSIKGGIMPKLLLDAQLIGHIYRNAVSNACKYGKQYGSVTTSVEFDSAKSEFRLEVINEPGFGHATLMAMGDSASEFVFAQGVRLQPHMKGKTEKKLDSSGDGAWIMQKCAAALKGICQIHFSTQGTHFTFQCPAVPVCQNTSPNYVDFVVPQNVRAIAIDDSKIQRKIMSRIFMQCGVEPTRQLLLGASPEDVTEFEATFMNLMEEHPTDKFLVIVDEHLDYTSNLNMSHKEDGVYSGSSVMKQILDNMPPGLLSRCLVLMRSANDSGEDIAMYTQRTHGYFPKAIMQKDRTREILAPLWLERFPEDAL